MRQKDYYEAYIDDYDKVVVYMSKQSYDGKSDRFYMKDSKDHFIELKIRSVEDTQANYTKYVLGIMGELTIGEEYDVYHEHARKTVAEYSYIVKTKRFIMKAMIWARCMTVGTHALRCGRRPHTA